MMLTGVRTGIHHFPCDRLTGVFQLVWKNGDCAIRPEVTLCCWRDGKAQEITTLTHFRQTLDLRCCRLLLRNNRNLSWRHWTDWTDNWRWHSHYRQQIRSSVDWCDEDYLQFKGAKTKEITVGFRRYQGACSGIESKWKTVERVKYMEISVDDKLYWKHRINAVVD